MLKFNIYNVPLDYKKADRMIDIQPLLTQHQSTKLSLTSDDGVTYTLNDGTSLTMSYKTESVNKKNYLEIDCSHLATEDKLLGIDKTYWFITNTVSANSMSNFKSNWVLDVFATYGSQVMQDLEGKPIKVIRQHIDRFRKEADNTLIASFKDSEMFTTEVDIPIEKCAKNISAFSNTKMVGDVKSSEIIPTGLFLIQGNEFGIDGWDDETGQPSNLYYNPSDANMEKIDWTAFSVGKQVAIDIVANRDYSGVNFDLANLVMRFSNRRSYSGVTRSFTSRFSRTANITEFDKLISNDGKTYKVTLEMISRTPTNNLGSTSTQHIVEMRIISAVSYIPASPSQYLDLWNDYFVNSTGNVQYALYLKKPYTDTMQGAKNPDVQLSGVLVPISTKSAADATWDVDNQLNRFQTSETLSIRNSNFVYRTSQDTKLTYGTDEKKLVTCANAGVPTFKSLPVKRKLVFNPSYEFDRIVLTGENKLVDYGFTGNADDWYYRYGGSGYVYDGDYWDSKTNEIFINAYFNTMLPSTNSLSSFNPRNEVKAMMSLMKMSLLYVPEGNENFISLEKLFRNTTNNHKYIWQQEYSGPSMGQIRSLILPTKNINYIANQFIANDTTITPNTQDRAKQYALENTNRIEAAKQGIDMQYRHQNANALQGAVGGALSGIVGGALRGGVAGVGAYMAVGGISSLASGISGMIQARESMEQAKKQLQAEIDDASAQPGSNNGGSNALLNNYSSISPECPWELSTYLPSEKLINSTAMYLHKYGYGSNETKFFSEELYKSRTNFNFIQLTEIEALNYTGNYHKEIVDLIQAELGTGVRIWHTTNIGDYTTGNVEKSLL